MFDFLIYFLYNIPGTFNECVLFRGKEEVIVANITYIQIKEGKKYYENIYVKKRRSWT
jgi:hypothetical protein